MKKLTLLLITLTLTISCGRKTKIVEVNSPPVIIEVDRTLPPIAVLSYTGNDARLIGRQITLDLSLLNQTIDARELLGYDICNNPSSALNEVTITSVDGRLGRITFSSLKYGSDHVVGTDIICRVFNNEKFDFVYNGKTLELRQIAV